MAVRSLHTVREDQYQHVWDNSVPPVLTVCSVAADLKISEIVDAPNWVVSFFLPHNLFDA